jgi:hypothetical protein
MENLLSFLLIRVLSPNTTEAIKTYNRVFAEPKKPTPKPKPTPKRVVTKTISTPKRVVTKTIPTPSVKKVITEEDELMESLTYFQNKSYQTKEDKESIRMIKLMLKNRK